jgi:hypothetical protein
VDFGWISMSTFDLGRHKPVGDNTLTGLLTMGDRGAFTGVNAGYITRNRNDLNAVEIAVGRVITDDDSGFFWISPRSDGGKSTHQISPRSMGFCERRARDHAFGPLQRLLLAWPAAVSRL